MIKFNMDGIVERFTLVLSTRNFKHLGALCNVSGLTYKDNINAPNEISFQVNKEVNEEKESLWNEINDLRVIWVKEVDEYFEITVKVDEEHDTVKNITGVALCESELSQVILYGLEINTEKDLIDGYYSYNKDTGMKEYVKGTGYGVGSIFYDESNPAKSILHRVLDKTPNYEIGHVDASLKTLTKLPEFTFDGTDVKGALDNIAEEFGCMFTYEIKNIDGRLTRVINAYDLLSNCMNDDCGYYLKNHQRYRGNFKGECPKCHSKHFTFHGKDTTIYTSIDNLTDSISLEAKVDELKNVFKLKGADDDMTTAIVNCNGGSQYMYNIPEFMRKDMSNELNERLNKYYSSLDLYRDSYADASKEFYNDLSWFYYLQSGMMPASAIQSQVTPDSELMKINTGFSQYSNKIALSNYTTSESSVVTAIKTFAKSFIFSGEVRVDVDKTKCSFTKNSKNEITSCSGTIVVTSFTDDSTASGSFSLTVTTEYSNYVQQRIENTISLYKDLETYDILGKIKDPDVLQSELIGRDPVLSITNADAFANSVKNTTTVEFAKTKQVGYSYNRIKSFYDAYEAAYTMLQSMDQTYIASFTEKYIKMKQVCGDVLDIRQKQMDAFDISIVSTPTYKAQEEMNRLKALMSFDSMICLKDINKGVYYKCTKGTPGAIQVTAENRKDIQYHIDVNIEDYVIYNYDQTYYKEFCNFRREDVYENGNYTSTGRNNDSLDLDTLYERAKEFINKATEELVKASTLQLSITSNLNNFLLIPDFEPIIEYFGCGNWIRIRVEEDVYRLRLISYSINFDSIQTIECEFSDVTKTANGYSDIEQVLAQASSMASSFTAVTNQAEAGNIANKKITSFADDGIQKALGVIKNNVNEEIVTDNNGILGRSYDPFTEVYSPKQFRLTSNMFMFTADNWVNGTAALGEHETSYLEFNGNSVITKTKKAYGLSADFIAAETVMANGVIAGSQIIGGDIYSSNYSESGNIGTHINLVDGSFSFAGGKLVYNPTTNKLTTSADITGSTITSSTLTSGHIYSKDNKTTHFNLNDGTFSIANEKLIFDGKDLKFGSDVKLSWSQVTGTNNVASKSDIPTSDQITQITKNTITTTYVNALNVKAGSVDAENITGTKISGKTITGGSIYGAYIANSSTNPSFYVTSEGKMYATDAEIHGGIYAEAGLISNFYVTEMGLEWIDLDTSYRGTRIFSNAITTEYIHGLDGYGLVIGDFDRTMNIDGTIVFRTTNNSNNNIVMEKGVLAIGGKEVATQSWVNSQGFAKGTIPTIGQSAPTSNSTSTTSVPSYAACAGMIENIKDWVRNNFAKK